MQGSFTSHTLGEQIRDLFLSEATGVLVLERGAQRVRLYLDRGLVVFADSTAEDEDLGKRLVGDGRVSAGALAEAQRSASSPRDLPRALLHRGLVARAALVETGAALLEQQIRHVFRWEAGHARFEAQEAVADVFEPDLLTTFDLFLKGISEMANFDPIRDCLLALDNRILLKRPSPVPLERLMLSPAHGFTLSRVDGHSTLREILSILPPGDEDPACRFLYGLLVLGVTVFDPPVGEPPFRVATVLRGQADQVALERMQERLVTEMVEGLGQRSPYQVLGVTHTTSREAVERAYEDIKERFSRDRILPRVRDKYRAELSLIESRLVEAYLTLTQARSTEAMGHDASATTPADGMNVDGLLVRVEMDKTKTKMAIEENARVAEAYFAKARKFAREGDFHNAIQYGKLAISYNSDDARVYLLLGDCLAKNPEARWQRLAEQNFLKAIELDPWNAEYRVELGRFYKKRGLKLRARKQFEWALEIVPGHAEAQGELRDLA